MVQDKKQHTYDKLIIDYSGEWIIPNADDEKGHNAGIKVRLPKTWLPQMDRMIKYGKLPYINRDQIVRHAMFMLFTWIETIPKKCIPKSDLGRIESMRTLLIEEAMLAGFNDVMVELAKRVAFCKAKGLNRRAAKHVLEILRIAEELKEEDWRNHFVDKIKKEYKNLLDSVEDINLYKKEE